MLHGLKFLKNSLIWASEEDHKEEWRTKMIEYVNMTADNEDDEYIGIEVANNNIAHDVI